MKFLLVLVFGLGSVLAVVSAKPILNDNKQDPGSLGRYRRAGMGSSGGAQLNKTMASTTEEVEILLKELTTQGTTERNNIFNRGKQRLQDHVNRLLNAAVGITRRVEQFLRGSFNNSFTSSSRDSSRGILDSIFGNRKPNLTA
ncbi:unnamed protein product [Allacma fusca]|uniref:Uncharacterized protein n=1 Tax=Allacma fusca TaxID=39272 RepID=A0A8J2LM44_9HEXA|nr:unnamed protein product [Allacma fusca]